MEIKFNQSDIDFLGKANNTKDYVNRLQKVIGEANVNYKDNEIMEKSFKSLFNNILDKVK